MTFWHFEYDGSLTITYTLFLTGWQLFCSEVAAIPKRKLYEPFLLMRFNCLKAAELLLEDSLLFTTSPQEFLVLNSSTRNDERLSLSWSYPMAYGHYTAI